MINNFEWVLYHFTTAGGNVTDLQWNALFGVVAIAMLLIRSRPKLSLLADFVEDEVAT